MLRLGGGEERRGARSEATSRGQLCEYGMLLLLWLHPSRPSLKPSFAPHRSNLTYEGYRGDGGGTRGEGDG